MTRQDLAVREDCVHPGTNDEKRVEVVYQAAASERFGFNNRAVTPRRDSVTTRRTRPIVKSAEESRAIAGLSTVIEWIEW
jgi:hypothetical protein